MVTIFRSFVNIKEIFISLLYGRYKLAFLLTVFVIILGIGKSVMYCVFSVPVRLSVKVVGLYYLLVHYPIGAFIISDVP